MFFSFLFSTHDSSHMAGSSGTMKCTPVFNFHRYSGDFHTRIAHSSLAIPKACLTALLLAPMQCLQLAFPEFLHSLGVHCLPFNWSALNPACLSSPSPITCELLPTESHLNASFPLQSHAIALVQAITLSYWATGYIGAAVWIDPLPSLST